MRIQGIPSPGNGLKLHLNENTGGCSPRVIDAIRARAPADICAYPNYRSAVLACAGYFGVDPEWILLTNGLDEGIFVTTIACFARTRDAALEAIVPVPAFDPYFTRSSAPTGRRV